MRVLLVTPDYPPAAGGIQNLLAGLVRHAREVEYDVLTMRAAGAPGTEPPGRARYVGTLPGPRIATVAHLAASAARLARRGHYDAVVSGHVVVGPGVAASGLPWMQYVYAKELPHRPALTREVLRRAHRVVSISEHSRRLAVDHGAPPSRTVIIPPGVDLPDHTTAPGRTTDGTTVVTVHRLDDEHKGTDVLIRAMSLVRARVPGARLRIVGDGRLRGALEALVDELGARDAVTFLGRVDDAQRDRELAGADVFSMLSRVPPGRGGEGFGIVFAEAAAHGLPVVAGDAGGARDAVDRDRTGLLVDPASVTAAADALVALLSDPDRRARMGTAGRSWSERFAWRHVTSRFEEVLRETIDAVGAARRGAAA